MRFRDFRGIVVNGVGFQGVREVRLVVVQFLIGWWTNVIVLPLLGSFAFDYIWYFNFQFNNYK